jgi:redox-sensing transcriptional repressor
MKFSKIPAATITRLSIYSRSLEELTGEDTKVISSERLAERCGVNSAQIRKDLAYFGEFGVRGVGYYIRDLLFEIKKILGLNKTWNLGLVGIGNLGSALIAHENFTRQGYIFVAAFDIDPHKINKKLPNGLKVDHIDRLKEVREAAQVEIGVISTPAGAAQDVANRFFEAGVRAILNFAPIQIQVPPGFMVENVDFTVKLDRLAYHLTSESGN